MDTKQKSYIDLSTFYNGRLKVYKKNMPIEIIQYQKFISVELMLMEKLKNYLQVNRIKEKQFYY